MQTLLFYLLAIFLMPLACTPMIVRQEGKARKVTLVSLLVLAGVGVAVWLNQHEDNQIAPSSKTR